MKIQILTQADCGHCRQLETFLKFGLQGQYNKDIEMVVKEEQPQKFEELVQKYNVQSTPVLIAGEKALYSPTPLEASEFLKKYTQE